MQKRISETGSIPSDQSATSKKLAVAAFFLLLLIPAYFELGGLRLSPMRILLLVSFIPLSIGLLAGRYGAVRAPDILLIAFCLWMVVALAYHHGAAELPLAAMTIVEMLGAYLFGRMAVRDPEGFRFLLKVHIWSLVFLLPFAIVETLTGRLIIPELVSTFADSHVRGVSAHARFGFDRVYSVFEHPILFGLYCSLAISNTIYSLRVRGFLKLLIITLAFVMSFLSLSSAPFLACLLQLALILWARFFNERWGLLLVLGLLFYAFVELAANRSPLVLFITYATFNPHTGWGRIAIFEAGSAAVMSSPLIGIGLNDWPRPAWVSSSVDNFWLLLAMRFGLTGLALLAAAIVSHFLLISRAKVADADTHRIRLGYIISLTALFFTLVTVHIWSATLIFVFFFLGAGAWLMSPQGPGRIAPSDAPEDDPDTASDVPRRRYTRFPGAGPAAPAQIRSGISGTAAPPRRRGAELRSTAPGSERPRLRRNP